MSQSTIVTNDLGQLGSLLHQTIQGINKHNAQAVLDAVQKFPIRVETAAKGELSQHLGNRGRPMTGNLLKHIHGFSRRLGTTAWEMGLRVSNVAYARILEYGGQTRPHDIYPRIKKALSFAMVGFMGFSGHVSLDSIVVRHVKHPGSRFYARYYLRTPLIRCGNELFHEIAKAIGFGK